MDEVIWALTALAVALFFISGPFVAWATRGQVRELRALVTGLQARVALLEAGSAGGVHAITPADETVVTASSSAEMLAEFRPEAETTEAVGPIAGSLDENAAATAASGAPPLPLAAVAGNLEGRLAERWLVWLGGLALALGGLFAAGWAIEQGLLGPGIRVTATALLGMGLIALGERMQRRSTSTPERPDYVPAALVSGGLCALYGDTIAAHQLYELLGPGLAMVLLALVSVLALALGLRFGWFVALLGTVGAHLAPLVVLTVTPSSWSLLLYLAALPPPLAVLARLQSWSWLAWVTLAGAALWSLLALVTVVTSSSSAAAGIHLLATGLAGLVLLVPSVSLPLPLRWPGRALVLAAGLLHLPLLVATDHATGGVMTLGLLTLGILAFAWRIETERWLAAGMATTTLLAAAAYALPPLVTEIDLARDPFIGLDPLIWIAPEAMPLATGLALIAALFGAVGFSRLWTSAFPGFWAALSATVPLAALAVAYWRLAGFAISPSYAGMALGLAVLQLFAAERVARRPELVPALGAYVVGVVGALALACTMTLETAWLTVALTVELAAMAGIARRLELPAIRPVALVLTLVVIVRAFLDVDFEGPIRSLPQIGYAYGLPVVALSLAAWRWRPPRPDRLVEVTSSAALLFWLLLVGQVVRWLVEVETAEAWLALAPLALNASAWGATGLALWTLGERNGAGLAIRLLAYAVLAGTLVQQLLLALPLNPLATGEPVGSRPLLNLLLPAYGLPAMLAFVLARYAAEAGEREVRAIAAGTGLILGLLWLTLEVRHAFLGPVLTGPMSDAESLAHSAAWLAFAALLLLAGIRLRRRWLRAAALGVASLAILKTFFYDMAELEGLYRAASFVGLGLCLIGVGWLYRRFVLPAPAAAVA